MATFAAVSSPGLRTSEGSSAASAGWNAPLVIVERATMQYTTAVGPSTQIVTAASTISAARTTSAAIITSFRSKRSASEAVNGAATAAGIMRMTVTSPTAAAPPWS